MSAFSIHNHPVNVIKRPRRKTTQLTITPENKITVLVPAYFTSFHIQFCLQRNAKWIEKKIKENKSKPKPISLKFITGDTIYYLGTSYTIKLNEAKQVSIKLTETELHFATPYADIDNSSHQEKRQKQLIDWYRKRAKDIIEDRTFIHAQNMGLSYNTLRIKQQKTRWGSCSSKKNLNFNWTLMMTPLPVLDYVVIHECAHLIHMNHSKDFWSVVERFCPEYKTHQKWLKKNGHLLTLI